MVAFIAAILFFIFLVHLLQSSTLLHEAIILTPFSPIASSNQTMAPPRQAGVAQLPTLPPVVGTPPPMFGTPPPAIGTAPPSTAPQGNQLLLPPGALFTSFRASNSFCTVIASSTGYGSSFSTPTKGVDGYYRGDTPCSMPVRRSPDSIAHFDQGYGNFSNTGPHPSRRVIVNGSPRLTNASSPAPSKKYKTQMCSYMLEVGQCRFGEKCHFAHSEQERNPLCPKDLKQEDQFLRPCSIMLSTGFW